MLNSLFQDDMQNDDIYDNPDSSSNDNYSSDDDDATSKVDDSSFGDANNSTYVLCKICRFELNLNKFDKFNLTP